MDDDKNLSRLEEVLLNKAILQLILRFLLLQDILKLRRINWFFKEIGDHVIAQRKCPVVFSRLFDLRFGDTDCINNNSHKFEMDGFIDNLASYKWHIPFENYIMESYQYDNMQAEVDDRLHCKISKTAKHITFVNDLKNDWSWSISESYPYLESVEFHTFGDFPFDKSFPSVTFYLVMERSPCLTKLGLTLENSTNSYTLTEFLYCLEATHARRIKHLQLNATFCNKHWNILRGLGFRLKTLKIDLSIIDYLDWSSIKKFLAWQSETLEELEINFEELTKPLQVTFPKMQKLDSLSMNFSTFCSNIQFPRLFYTIQFPRLKKLLLRGEYKQCTDWYLQETMRNSWTVKYLELPAFSNIALALKIFPKVKELRCCSGDISTLGTLLSFRNLEKLTLYANQFSESALERFVTEQIVDGQILISKGFCERLKYIKLEGMEMTDVTVEFILQISKSLQLLDLWDCDRAEISGECLEEMRKQITVYIQPSCIQAS